jgi:hypothetical protein
MPVSHDAAASSSIPRFVPEVLVRNKAASDALKMTPNRPRVIMFNYHDLKAGGFPNSSCRSYAQDLVAELDNPVIILNSIGADRHLDNFDTIDYCNVAEKLGAKYVLSPDDYIYASDDKFPTFQNFSYLRTLVRTKKLIRLADGRFEPIGLVLGRSDNKMEYFYSKLKEYGISKFAFSCGDLLKARSRDSHRPIFKFLEICRRSNAWHVLVGIHSSKYLRAMVPHCYASNEWSMAASHFRAYSVNYKSLSYKQRELNCEACHNNLNKKTHIAIHNLNADFKHAENVEGRQTYGWL